MALRRVPLLRFSAEATVGLSSMAQGEQRVTPLEIFFDLVFVYAITQVTRLMSDDPKWQGVG